nr:reverse transcriptase domain-containing protein [Tanacetum cinerariifolium]
MRTRSKSYPNNSNATIPRRSNRSRVPNIAEPEIRTIEEVVPMADSTMEELLQAPTEGYGEVIVIPEVIAENFEIKTNLLQLVQTNKFHGFERDNPYTHISNFKRMTLTLKYRDTTHLKNEISRFTQRFEESFGEAWERFKEMLRACPHHGFSELTQIDTFYNGLNEQDHDFLNAMTGGNLLSKTTREALKIIKNKSKVRYSRSKSNVSRVNANSRDSSSKTDDRIDKLADQISNLVEIVNKQVITPATAKAAEKTCVICRGAHAYYDCIATDSNQPSVCAATGTYNQVSLPNRASNQISPPGFAPALTSGTLPSNTVPNPKGEMKVVTTRSGLAYEGPSIPTNSPLEKVVEQDTEEITDKEHYNCQGSTAHIQPSVIPILEPDVLKTQLKPNILYPSRLNDQKLREKATNQIEKFFQIFHDLHFDISFANALLLMPKFSTTIKSLLMNKDKLFELTKVPLNENCLAMLLKKLPEKLGDPDKFLIPCDFPGIDVCHAWADLGASINLMPLSIWKKLSLPELTPTRMTLELADRSITHFEADPRVPLILERSFLRTGRALIDVYGEEITLRVNDESYNSKSSNPTLVSNPSFFEKTKSEFCKEPIVKSSSPTLTPFGESDFFLEEIEDFLNDESIQTAIENSLYDPEGDILYLEKLLNDDTFQLPPIDLKQAEETKAKYSIEEPPELELKELPSHLEYAFLEDTDKLPIIIAKLAGNEFYCFLDGFSGYFQIPIDPQDQEKTTFTCPYGTFAYRRMPFGLCNALGTFQREAWDHFKEMLRACPHHGFSKLTQIDTFYNGLTEQDQDSLNAATGGNIFKKTIREAMKIIENKSKILNLVKIVNKQVINPAAAKAVEKICVTCGGAHAYYDCIATDSTQRAGVRHENFKVALHLNFPDHEVAIEGTLSAKGRTELCSLLKENLDIFAWHPSDMTGVPRSVAEHQLNIQEGYSLIWQKKRARPGTRQGHTSRGAKVSRGRDHERDFTDLNRACPQDCYTLLEIDWKVKSLCGYHFKCFLDAYKGYHQIQLAGSDEEKWLSTPAKGQIGRNIEVYVDDLVVKSHTEAKMLRYIGETFCTLRKINMKLNPKKCTFGAVEGMFLGYMVTPEGIKPCPDKTEVVLQLPSPRTIKEVQSLNGKLASLNRFLSNGTSLQATKQHLSELLLLVAPKPKEELIVYMSASYEAISAVLMTEKGTVQKPVYFVSRVLQGLELNYTPMEKIVLSLVFTAKRFRRPRTSVKGQFLADFLTEMPDESQPDASVVETQQEPWKLFTDGSSCVDGSGAGLILTSPEGTEFTYTLRF